MIRLTGLSKRFAGSAQAAVDNVSLDIAEGEVCVLIGPSGCGKTTTMRLINRMIEPDAGRIEVGGKDVTHMDVVALRRSIGYVIQQVGLFPHMTIADNIATVPRPRRRARQIRRGGCSRQRSGHLLLAARPHWRMGALWSDRADQAAEARA